MRAVQSTIVLTHYQIVTLLGCSPEHYSPYTRSHSYTTGMRNFIFFYCPNQIHQTVILHVQHLWDQLGCAVRLKFNICGINLGVLYVLLWPTEPRWLTCNISSFRNGMPSHSRKWPGWWPAWGGVWLHMDLPHATEVPETECKITEVYGQHVPFSYPYFVLSTVGECNLKCSKQQRWIPTEQWHKESLTGHFGTFLLCATHTFACVAHSMNAWCLQALPHCGSD